MQMGCAEQTMPTYLLATGTDEPTKVTSINYIVKNDVHLSLFKNFINQSDKLLIGEGVAQFGERSSESAIVPLV